MFRFITNFLEPVACVVYLIAMLINYRKSASQPVAVLTGYYFLAAIFLTMGCFGVGAFKNNIWVYDVLALLTAICVGVYFYRILHARQKKMTVLSLTGGYILYSIVRNLTLQGDHYFDSVGFALVSASIVVYVFMYFQQVLKNVTETNILSEFNFWLSSGYLLYFFGSFIVFVSYSYFTVKYFKNISRADQHLLTALWGFHNVLLFVGALSLLVGSIWVTYRRKSR